MRARRSSLAAEVLIILLSISNALAQAGQVESAPSSEHLSNAGKEIAPATVVKASDPVVTVHALCEDQSIPLEAANSCTTVITREKFETLLNSMNIMGKTLTPETRRSLAVTYAQYLALERPATKAGFDSTGRFEEIMRWWRLRTLADMYRANLQEQFKHSSQEEIHAYYIEHLSSYQRLKTARVLVPRTLGTTDEAKRTDEKALQLAKVARERVANGEEPELVQKDAYSSLGLSSALITDLGLNPRSSFPTEERDELFSLGPGQVSKVETEGASYVIYKIASKDTLSEESVKEEISRQIAQDKFNEAIRSINQAAKPEFNEAYFGPPEAASPAIYSGGQSGSPHP